MQGLPCGRQDLVPWPGIEPGPPALEARCLRHWTSREVPAHLYMFVASCWDPDCRGLWDPTRIWNESSPISLNGQVCRITPLSVNISPALAVFFWAGTMWWCDGRSCRGALSLLYEYGVWLGCKKFFWLAFCSHINLSSSLAATSTVCPRWLCWCFCLSSWTLWGRGPRGLC